MRLGHGAFQAIVGLFSWKIVYRGVFQANQRFRIPVQGSPYDTLEESQWKTPKFA